MDARMLLKAALADGPGATRSPGTDGFTRSTALLRIMLVKDLGNAYQDWSLYSHCERDAWTLLLCGVVFLFCFSISCQFALHLYVTTAVDC